jgi:hypothetical protein
MSISEGRIYCGVQYRSCNKQQQLPIHIRRETPDYSMVLLCDRPRHTFWEVLIAQTAARTLTICLSLRTI